MTVGFRSGTNGQNERSFARVAELPETEGSSRRCAGVVPVKSQMPDLAKGRDVRPLQATTSAFKGAPTAIGCFRVKDVDATQ
jgi:hypothetical protein